MPPEDGAKVKNEKKTEQTKQCYDRIVLLAKVGRNWS